MKNTVDDLLVWGETAQEHDCRIKKTPAKSKRAQSQTELTAGFKADEEKVRAVAQLPEPEDKQALQRFLCCGKFIPNL